jgi:hypothetical protein
MYSRLSNRNYTTTVRKKGNFMKKLTCCLIALTLCLTVTACAESSAAPANYENTQQMNIVTVPYSFVEPLAPLHESVELVISNVSPAGLNFMFINNTDEEFLYGERFRLFERQGDTWYEVDIYEGREVLDYGIIMFPQSESEVFRREFFPEPMLAQLLPPGEYMFAVEFSHGGVWEGIPVTNFSANQVFTIDTTVPEETETTDDWWNRPSEFCQGRAIDAVQRISRSGKHFAGMWLVRDKLHISLTTDDPKIIQKYEQRLEEYLDIIVFETNAKYSYSELNRVLDIVAEAIQHEQSESMGYTFSFGVDEISNGISFHAVAISDYVADNPDRGGSLFQEPIAQAVPYDEFRHYMEEFLTALIGKNAELSRDLFIFE